MELSQRQFKKFSDLVYHECGIFLHEGKQQLLSARLAKRLRRTGINSADEYLKVLKSDVQERIAFLDVISTNHTFFFRENHHFNILESQHRRIWCAASSSGEEPYSIAIHCLEKGFKPEIDATDISTNALSIGAEGIYPIEKVKSLPMYLLKKYFQKGQDKWEGYIRVKNELKQIVNFRRFNLTTDPDPQQEYDIVFCRNVFIYFDNQTKVKVVDKLYNVIREKGYLVIGGAESLNNLKHRFKYVKPSIYLKD